MAENRSFHLNDKKYVKGSVVYWMQRDQRVNDNYALIHAFDLAENHNTFVSVVFNLCSGFTNAADAHYRFMLSGLEQLRAEFERLNIPFFLLYGNPADEIPAYVAASGAGCVVTDFMPLKIVNGWKSDVAARLNVPLVEVDAHNIVPCRIASPKKEYAAATFRPKIKRLLPEYLIDFPEIKPQTAVPSVIAHGISFGDALVKYPSDVRLPFVSGEKCARAALESFIKERLTGYASKRNNPNNDAQSGLSPYFHFGQLSPQRAALSAMASDAPQEDKDAFLEELIVRRELADNYCFYNSDYDCVSGADNWALKTIDEHRRDVRQYIYDYETFCRAETHDDLWNAAQTEMMTTGKMHGYMRMYWAKKILEWTPDAETAFSWALLLNDTYSMDGRDPNGYVGVAWSIAGVHDRAWAERPVFGKIRYMNYNGCRSKFDVKAYIDKIKKPIL